MTKMRTVQQVCQGLAEKKIPLYEAVDDFQHRDWPARQKLSPDVLAGVSDPPPISVDSVDWIELQPNLTDEQRHHLRLAYDRATR